MYIQEEFDTQAFGDKAGRRDSASHMPFFQLARLSRSSTPSTSCYKVTGTEAKYVRSHFGTSLVGMSDHFIHSLSSTLTEMSLLYVV
jgi:hypothetical protein